MTRFSGGIHPKEKKIAKLYRIQNIQYPQYVYLHLSQHTGKPAVPIVKEKDYVLRGQKVAQSDGLISACIHSPVSGQVVGIKDVLHPVICKKLPAVVIESDGKFTTIELKPKYKEYHRFSPQELVGYIKECGIVGLGGAMFPTDVKLSPPKDKVIDYVIANGCECEPYLTSDDRLMQEYYDEIIEGLKIAMYILDALKGIVVVEDNKPDAIEKIKRKIERTPNVELRIVKTKYPQGAEKQLIQTVLNREVPSGGLPMDVGVVVQNVATLKAIYDAIFKGLPLIERVVTISGDIERLGNFVVPIGMMVKDVVKVLNINISDVNKIIFGGPMMGIAQESLEVPIIKGTSGILFLRTVSNKEYEYYQCVRCGKCVYVCPMKLMPNFLSIYIEHQKWGKVEKYSPFDCIECGCCSYICIAKRPIVAQIKYAKTILTTLVKK
ncbi:MAG: electron transport complex subunit RsxC [Endomicrobia bacterium]|nr:electron transport complex subunit RsxC [Endomicrobiia bacterium]MCX7941101.1 electron transport complex subunit RsxC [Endomicrobiia bacterium]MDW8055247.1 electron transport complex subunit RsxC [Elusimicrobiota bacterium]